MRHQFKPGDLAILKSSEAEHLVGSVVELIDYVGSGEHLIYNNAVAFNSKGSRIWWVSITSGTQFISPARGVVTDGFCAEERLIPLRDDFAPEQQKAREVEPCL